MRVFSTELAGLALHIADHAAQPGAQLLHLAAHAAPLLGVCIAASLGVGGFANPRVALAQLDAGLLRRGHQLLSSPVQQPTVGGVRNRLGLHRGVHDHGVQALPLHHARRHRRLDAVLKQPLAAFLADALPPAHQARRIAGQLVPEVALAAEVLPVRVLDPAFHHVFIRQRERVLQVQQ
jgi:hypothetical protein